MAEEKGYQLHVGDDYLEVTVPGEGGLLMEHPDDEDTAAVRHMVAAANACAGISPEQLDQGIVGRVQRLLVRCQSPIGYLATEEARRNAQRKGSGLPIDRQMRLLQTAIDELLADLGGQKP